MVATPAGCVSPGDTVLRLLAPVWTTGLPVRLGGGSASGPLIRFSGHRWVGACIGTGWPAQVDGPQCRCTRGSWDVAACCFCQHRLCSFGLVDPGLAWQLGSLAPVRLSGIRIMAGVAAWCPMFGFAVLGHAGPNPPLGWRSGASFRVARRGSRGPTFPVSWSRCAFVQVQVQVQGKVLQMSFR